jgi:hypothetical protein
MGFAQEVALAFEPLDELEADEFEPDELAEADDDDEGVDDDESDDEPFELVLEEDLSAEALESDLLSAAGAVDFSSLPLPERESLR